MNENVKPDVANRVEDPKAFVAKIKAEAAAERKRRQKLEAEHPPIELLKHLANPANPYPKKPLLKSVPVETDRLEAEQTGSDKNKSNKSPSKVW